MKALIKHRSILIGITILFLFGCSKQLHLADIDTSYYRIDQKASTEDEEINKLIAPYKDQLDAQMNEVIGQIDSDMVKSKPNSTLGNWFADAMLEETNYVFEGDYDMAFQNYGGIRIQSLPEGDVRIGKIYELMPFENFVVVMDLEGPVVQLLLDRIADYGGWPISHTLCFTIKDGKATDIIIKGEPFDIDKSYSVVLPDYTANGGDNCEFLKSIPKVSKNILLREILIQNIKRKTKNGKSIKADASSRINIVE